MPIRKQYPVHFRPTGLADAFDQSNAFPGACLNLVNLVFDPAQKNIVVARPGVGDPITSFAGFTTPGVVSVQITIGDIVYGMIESQTTPGYDEPFVYDHANDVFIAISGVTGANVPATQATTGPWTPPTITNVGVYIIITHPGFPGGGKMFGVIDITNPAAPAWSASDTATNGLTGVPTAVANFNNRAYFAVSNKLEYTDVLSLTRTNSSQSLTIGDASSVLGLCGLPVQTTSSGVFQALLAFKFTQIWQITGDTVGSTLAQNYLSLEIGSNMPRTILSTPEGVKFCSVWGPYIVDLFGVVRPLTSSQRESEPDIQVPFQACTEPSRACAGYAGTTYRVCLDTVIRGTAARNDYWYDEHRRRWNGPHTFPYDCASQHEDHFILASNANPAALFHSRVTPDAGSVFTDNGVAFAVELTSSAFPDTGRMLMKQVVESIQELSSSGVAVTYQLTAQDDQGNTLATASVTTENSSGLWGSGTWGDGQIWVAANNAPHIYTVEWDNSIVFQKLIIDILATPLTVQLSIGQHGARYQDAGYTNAG